MVTEQSKKTKLNILLLAPVLEYRGSCIYTLNLSGKLSQMGHSVELVCGKSPMLKEFTSLPIKITQFEGFPSLLKNIFWPNTILKYLKSKKFNIIHATTPRLVNIAASLSKKMGVPYIFTAHNLITKRIFYRRVRCSGIIAISESVRETLVNNGKVEKEKVKVIYSGVDIDHIKYLRPFKDNAELYIIGMIAPYEKDKGQETLIKAAKEIRANAKNILFILLGEGPEEEIIRRLARQLNVKKYFTFSSNMPDYYNVLQELDILTYPAKRLGLGTTLLEGMAHGKPVVASAVGGVFDVIEDGKTGILVEKDNPSVLAQAIIKLINDPKKGIEIGLNARHKVIEKFNASRMAQETEDFYFSVIKE